MVAVEDEAMRRTHVPPRALLARLWARTNDCRRAELQPGDSPSLVSAEQVSALGLIVPEVAAMVLYVLSSLRTRSTTCCSDRVETGPGFRTMITTCCR